MPPVTVVASRAQPARAVSGVRLRASGRDRSGAPWRGRCSRLLIMLSVLSVRHPAIVVGCVASIVACARQRGGETAPVTLTAAQLPTEAETTDPTPAAFAARLSGGLCARETRCGREADEPACAALANRAARAERRCPPAARRARIEECLASINSEPCAVDLAHFPSPLCPLNDECPADRALVAPGPALAEIWRLRPGPAVPTSP